MGAAAAPTIHFAVHKPAGMLSSSRDERGRRSVVHLLDRAAGIARGRLWPAGRLDVSSEGLMVLTNDGAWANRFLHPRYGVEREYAVLLDRAATADEIEQLLQGVRWRTVPRACWPRSGESRRPRWSARRTKQEPGCACGWGRAASARCVASSPPSACACCGWCGRRSGR